MNHIYQNNKLVLGKTEAQCRIFSFSDLLPKNTPSNKISDNNCFIDFSKAFDSINHEVIWAVLKSYRVNKKLIRIMKLLYDSTA